MAYKALYRTYRPSTFEEVAGQDHIVKTLQNAFRSNKLAHAYLFCGPRGTGKTSMAKLVAKALNCEEGLGHQCNKCSNCLATLDGSHPDVIEIDAASNNGVDEVRDLIEKVKYLPIKGKYKVYIIDEVHMMTSGAFNALLKTLEEPPSHVIFILATTDAHKVIPTIVSRCQRYDFSKVDDQDIINRLKYIFNKEGVTFEESALKSIASLADGGVRDALSIADQVIAYSGSSVLQKDVEDLFGLASLEEKINFIIEINNSNTKYVLEKMNDFIASGIDIKRLTNDLLDILKDIIILNDTNDLSLLVKLKGVDAYDIAASINNTSALMMINILLKGQSEYRFVSNLSSLFQITLLNLLNVNKSNQKEVSKEVKKVSIKDEKVTLEPARVETPLKEEKRAASIDESLPPLKSEGERNYLPEDTIIELMVVGDKDLKLSLQEKWVNLNNYKFHPSLSSHALLLSSGKPYIMNTKLLVLEYQFAHLSDKVNIIENQKTLRQLVKMVTGVDIMLYAICKNESHDAQKRFMELRQISKLPKVTLNDIDIEIKGE